MQSDDADRAKRAIRLNQKFFRRAFAVPLPGIEPYKCPEQHVPQIVWCKNGCRGRLHSPLNASVALFVHAIGQEFL